MQRINVDSSNISSIGYDPDSQILEVEFHSGSIYQYEGVPQHEHSALMNANSHGQYLNEHIKGVYPYRQVR